LLPKLTARGDVLEDEGTVNKNDIFENQLGTAIVNLNAFEYNVAYEVVVYG
jgi:hypothetical protein